MLTFAVCILFGANPDAFLPEQEFAAKYLAKYFGLVEACGKSLKESVEDILHRSTDESHFLANIENQRIKALALDKALKLLVRKRAEARLLAVVAAKAFQRQYGDDE
jgi:hypothetical protein